MKARKKRFGNACMCACVRNLVCPNGISFFFVLFSHAQAQLCSAITLYYCASIVTANSSNLFIEAHGLRSNFSSQTSTVRKESVVLQSPFYQLRR